MTPNMRAESAGPFSASTDCGARRPDVPAYTKITEGGCGLQMSQVDNVDARTLAEWLDCSEQSVRNFARDGDVKRVGRGRYALKDSVVGVLRRLRGAATGRAESPLSTERALLAKAQREAVEHKLAIARKEYLLAKDVANCWDGMCLAFRNRMLALPSWLSQEAPHLTRADIDIVDRMIRDALTELANMADEEGI